MSMHGLNDINYRLIGLLQDGFPLVEAPYAALGAKLGIIEEQVIRRIEYLKHSGIVRIIGPVLDARGLGYQSTLVALKVEENRISEAERYLIAHPGIGHGYERDHEFNIWITLSLPADIDLKLELDTFLARTHASMVIALPAARVFKLRTHFGPDEESVKEHKNHASAHLFGKVDLSDTDRLMINALQQDLPLVPHPFKPLADRLRISVDDLLKHCISLEKRGVIRRYGGSINHSLVGYKANAMSCWKVPAEKVDEMGSRLASQKQVSHCYERQTNSCWPYNVFAMIHGSSKKECMDVVYSVSSDSNLTDFVVLFSTKEFKKTRIKYKV